MHYDFYYVLALYKYFTYLTCLLTFYCCIVVDCQRPTSFYNGYIDGQQTTFGSTIVYRFFVQYTNLKRMTASKRVIYLGILMCISSCLYGT